MCKLHGACRHFFSTWKMIESYFAADYIIIVVFDTLLVSILYWMLLLYCKQCSTNNNKFNTLYTHILFVIYYTVLQYCVLSLTSVLCNIQKNSSAPKSLISFRTSAIILYEVVHIITARGSSLVHGGLLLPASLLSPSSLLTPQETRSSPDRLPRSVGEK